MRRLSIAFLAPHAHPALRARLGLQPEGGYGGAEVQMALIGLGLAQRGHRITFLCRGPAAGSLVGPIRILGFDSGPGPSRRLPWLGVVAALRRSESEVIYQRCAQTLTGFAAWHCRRTGARFVFAVANDRDLDGRARLHLGPFRHALFQYGLRRADAVVCQSRRQQDLLPEMLRARAAWIPSAFDLDGVAPRPEPTAPAVLWVANLLEKKRPIDLLSLAAALPEIRFIAVAPEAGDRGLATRFAAAAARLPNVERHSWVGPDAISALYARATVLLNTSDAEGVPNTFLEAWARGIPVVSLEVDPDGLLESMGLGRVIGREHAAKGMRLVLEDAAARRAAGERGRAHVASSHGLTTVLDRYESLLADVLTGGEPGRDGV